MIFSQIKDNEIDMINAYRRNYSISSGASIFNSHFAPAREVLYEWQVAKNQHLFKLFGGNLILSKDVSYEKSADEASEELDSMLWKCYDGGGRKQRNGSTFYDSWNNWLFDGMLTYSQRNSLSKLLSNDCLFSNIYDGSLVELEKPNGKKLKINKGCKTIKALGKIAEAFELEGFEDFRICHSQILNQKHLSGKLNISIHPLDYMTMSDNECGWDTCMSWREEGGYRQGTVEMLNSPTVVVAYLSSDENKMYIHGESWNSKKWRQLFIVDKNTILAIKDYPYHNESLGKEVINWIKDLAKENLGWEYDEVIGIDAEDRVHLKDNDVDMYCDIMLNCYHMYNDFGCLSTHLAAFAKTFNKEDFCYHYDSYYTLNLTYGGLSQCMICGKTEIDFDNPSCLACNDCQEIVRCDSCGEECDESELFEVDGLRVCEFCYDRRVHECEVCGESHLEDNLERIFILPNLTEEQKQNMIDYKRENGYRIPDKGEPVYMSFSKNSWICPEEREAWEKKYLKPGETMTRRKLRWYDPLCVYFDQLNELGREVVCDCDTNEDYRYRFSQYDIEFLEEYED
jgi:hypothetical protein